MSTTTSTANAVTLISGPSGSGKTSLIATAAEWLWKTQKKTTRLYVVDGGGFGTKIEALIRVGIIEVWRMRTRVGSGAEGLVEETCARASQGYWPVSIKDPLTGAVAEGVELVPPMAVVYTLLCSKGHVVKTSSTQKTLNAVQCAQCKTLVTMQNGQVQTSAALTPGIEKVGAHVFEGLTSMSDWIMMSLADRTGRQELQGEKSAIGRIQSGNLSFGGNNRSHYGFAQTQAERWLLNSTTIPGCLLPPIWTALEARVDEAGGVALPFYGPSIAGQAKTGKVPQWVGNYLGTAIVIDGKGNRRWRLYLTEYRGEDGIPHLYKTRAEPGVLPEYLEDGDGAPFSGFSLGVFFSLLAGALDSSTKKVLELYPDAPGMKAPGEEKIVEKVEVSAPVPASVSGAASVQTPGPVAAPPTMKPRVGPPPVPSRTAVRPPAVAPRTAGLPAPKPPVKVTLGGVSAADKKESE